MTINTRKSAHTRLLGTSFIASSLQAFVIMVCICDLPFKKNTQTSTIRSLKKISFYELSCSLESLPEEANLLRERNTQVLRDGNNRVFECYTIDNIVGEVLGDLKRERSIANHKLPYLLPS